jgi:hypothetical protein
MACEECEVKMKTENPFTCDGPGCDHVKQECNHWFLLYPLTPAPAFVVNEWDDANARLARVKHACGEACLLKIISEHIKKATEEK